MFILKSYALTTATSGLNRIDLTPDDPATYTATSMVGTIVASSRSKAISITGNDQPNSILGGKGADKIDGGAGADTLSGGAGNDSLTGGAGADVFLYASGEGKDVITDYVAGDDVIKLTSGDLTKVAVDKKGNLTFTVDKNKGTFKVNDGQGKSIHILNKDGDTLVKQKFGDKVLTISDDDFSTINASIDAAMVTVEASSRVSNVHILGNSKKNVFNLGLGFATVETGDGKDTIIHNGGYDLVTDYKSGQDVLKFTAALSDVQLSGNDLIFSSNSSQVTLQGAKDQKISVRDMNDNLVSVAFCSSTVTIGNKDGDTIQAYTGTEVLDASKRSKAVYLIGSSDANTITGSKKDDTLTGGDGADTFVYTNNTGNDIITDYSASAGDVIQLGKKTYISDAAVDGNDYVISFAKGSLTIKDGANQTIRLLDSNNNRITLKAPDAVSDVIDTQLDDILSDVPYSGYVKEDDVQAVLLNDSTRDFAFKAASSKD